jgi:hypothetical protein
MSTFFTDLGIFDIRTEKILHTKQYICKPSQTPQLKYNIQYISASDEFLQNKN